MTDPKELKRQEVRQLATRVLALALNDKACLDRLCKEFEPNAFPKGMREFAKIVWAIPHAMRAHLTQDVLSDYLKTAKCSTEVGLTCSKIFLDCQAVKTVPGEFEYFLPKLKEYRADAILRETLRGVDEDDQPVYESNGQAKKGIVDLIKDGKPFDAADTLKLALASVQSLSQSDQIIRVELTERAPAKLAEYEHRKTHQQESLGLLTGFGPLDDVTRGIGPGELALFAGRPGCLSGDTEIYDPITGLSPTIKQIVEQQKGLVACLNETTQKLECKKIGQYLDQGVRPTWTITTNAGSVIRATANHPFLTWNGWKELKDLSINDHIATIKKAPEPLRCISMEKSLICLLAHFIAEGGGTQEGLTYTNGEELIVNDCREALMYYGASLYLSGPCCYNITTPLKVKQILRSYDLLDKYSWEKTLPDDVLRLNNADLALFLGRLWSTDGSVWTSRETASYGCASPTLTKAIRKLLLRFDIRCSYVERANDRRGSFELQITGKRDLKKFKAAIGPHLLGSRAQILSTYDLDIQGNVNVDMVPPQIWSVVDRLKNEHGLSWKALLGNKHNGLPFKCRAIGASKQHLEKINQKLNSTELDSYINSDIYWDSIQSIQGNPNPEQVYDLTITVHIGAEPNFVANNFIAHNSGKSICLLNAAKTMFKAKKNVMLFSLEMPYQQYEDRFISSYAGIHNERMLIGALTAEEETKLKNAWNEVHGLSNKFEIVDFPRMDSFTIETELSRAIDKYHPDVVLIDYLGIMKPNDKNSTADWEQQGKISDEVRTVARLYRIPILSAVQLNRSKTKEKSTDRLSRSDMIAQNSDIITMINDDDDKQAAALSDLMKYTVIKNRKGADGFEFEMYKNFSTITLDNLPSYKSRLQNLMLGTTP